MKKLAGIFLLTVYMTSFAELHNLARVPVLLSHFKEHRQQDPELSFWAFIKLHYFDPLVVDDDYQRDRQLPFRDTDFGHVATISYCDRTPAVILPGPPAEPLPEFPLFNEQNKPQFPAFDIFQPPRVS